MFDTLKRDVVLCALAAAIASAVANPSFAQPTEAQKEAVKSACRSDFMAHCSSVQPGGEAALQCLAKNMSSLSSGCASAVKAIEASAAPKSEPAAAPKTETTTAKPAAEPKAESKAESKGEAKTGSKPAAGKPTDAQVSAIRTACRSDYPKVCAGVPTGGAPALECLEKNKARVSASCSKALAAAGGGAAPAASGGGAPAAAGAAPAAAATVIVLRPMLPREELFVMRSACGGDIRTLCAGVAPGGGRIMQCISNRAADLSPACKDVLTPFMAR